MYIENDDDSRDKIIGKMIEISEERENLYDEGKLDKEKERELILKQFYLHLILLYISILNRIQPFQFLN